MVMLGTSWTVIFFWMKIAFHPKFSSDASFFAARDVKNLPRPKAEKPQNGTLPHIQIVPWVELKSWPFKGGVLSVPQTYFHIGTDDLKS